MYQLKEMIGEEKVNLALKSLIEKFAYQSPPYPTSLDLVDALREQTPAEFHYLLRDLFEEIVLFENRAEQVTCRKIDGDKFEVTLKLKCEKFKAIEDGEQVKIDVDDWIEIGAFAKPEAGREFGKTLHRQRVKISEEDTEFKFVVSEMPDLVGVDPFLLLIDRSPDDNMKKPSLAN